MIYGSRVSHTLEVHRSPVVSTHPMRYSLHCIMADRLVWYYLHWPFMSVTETGYDVITFNKYTSENSHHVGLPHGRFYGESTGIGNIYFMLHYLKCVMGAHVQSESTRSMLIHSTAAQGE